MRHKTYEFVCQLPAQVASERIERPLSKEGVKYRAADLSVTSVRTPIAALGIQPTLYSHSNWVGVNPFTFVSGVDVLWETLHPDRFLVDHEPMYLWLTRVWMYYVKAFYPAAQKFETDPADGAKTRDLIRQHVDVEELKRNMPTYVLDADYLTKIKDRPPDSKALDIEAMLASELQLRMGEDEEFQPLSERLKRIVQRKRSGTVAGLALLKELEELAKETVALILESQRPIAESIAKAAQERSPGLSAEDAAKIAASFIRKADEILFPGWTEQEHMDIELFREFTKVLAKDFPAAGLHERDKDFVARCIKLLRKANYRAKSDE